MALRNRRVFELRVGKLGLSLLVGGISLLMFVFFLLGVFMGRHMDAYPERYAAGLMELVRGSFSTAPPASPLPGSAVAGENVEGEGEFGLTFYETLGGKGAGAKRRPKGPAEQRVASDPSEATQSNEAENQKAEGRGAVHESALSAGPAPPQESEQGQEKGVFEIQVAAYRERHKANDTAKKIASLGLSPRVVVKDLPGKGRWFRVIVNGFHDRRAAQEAGELISEKIPGLRVVIRSASAGQ